jgi:hypothetical protein
VKAEESRELGLEEGEKIMMSTEAEIGRPCLWVLANGLGSVFARAFPNPAPDYDGFQREITKRADKLKEWWGEGEIRLGYPPGGHAQCRDKEVLKREVLAVVAGWWKERLKAPTQVEIAAEFGLARENFNRLLKDRGLEWLELKRRPS